MRRKNSCDGWRRIRPRQCARRLVGGSEGAVRGTKTKVTFYMPSSFPVSLRFLEDLDEHVLGQFSGVGVSRARVIGAIEPGHSRNLDTDSVRELDAPQFGSLSGEK